MIDLEYSEAGEPGRNILFFVHGWPDSGELWRPQVNHFSARYHCVAITLPQFGRNQIEIADFSALADAIYNLISQLKTLHNQPNVILVGHDWGAYLCYLVDQKYPGLAKSMITMDVGGELKPTSPLHALFILTYQWWLIAAFFLGKVLPKLANAMTQQMSLLAKAPRGRAVHYKMNYLYHFFWRGLLLQKWRFSILRNYTPTRPLLYLYGERKKFHFHSATWLLAVEKTPKGRVVAMPCHHWINVEKPQQTNEAMESWLAGL